MAAFDTVLLAAGRSSRAGAPKGLVPWRGRAWIEHQLQALPGRAIVVLGLDRDRYLAEVPSLASRAEIVVNPDPDRGPFSSLQLGLAAARGAVFVLPVDVPAPSSAVWTALADALHADAAVPVLGDRGGHPVLLAEPFAARLRTLLPPDARLDEQLKHGRANVTRVPVGDPRVGMNLNTPRDWGQLSED